MDGQGYYQNKQTRKKNPTGLIDEKNHGKKERQTEKRKATLRCNLWIVTIPVTKVYAPPTYTL